MNLKKAISEDRELFRPPPKLTVSQWADAKRKLSSEASAEPGNWDTNRAPFQREMMDAVNEDDVSQVVIMSSAQVGKTEILLNCIGYFTDQDPSPILVLQPTEHTAEAFSKDRLAPMIRDCKDLMAKIGDSKSRFSENTILHKKFPGGHITLVGTNSPAGLASRPIRCVFPDEVDRYPVTAGSEGDPLSLAIKRTTTFWNSKVVMTSTPTVKGFSRIETAYLASDQRRYYVQCPHCEESQVLKWGGPEADFGIKWVDSDPKTAYYMCEHCQAGIHESDKYQMVFNGEWRAHAPFKGIAGFHINELYSPWKKWSDVVTDFIEAKKFPDTLKVWVNTSLGETWEEKGERVDDGALISRREEYNAPCPFGVLLLTAGVDVQDDRLEVEIKGWGAGEESWGIEYRVLWGDPSESDVWESLTDVLSKDWLHESGLRLRISATCIDSGGHKTQEVYDYCKTMKSQRVFATKGVGGLGKPVISSPSAKRTGKNKRAVELFTIGVDEAKRLVMGRLQRFEPGPGYFHFPVKYNEEYFKQLTAEKIVTRYIKGFPKQEFVKTRPRNEAFDITVLAYAALKLVNPVWEALAEKIPNTKISFTQQQQSTPKKAAKGRRVRSKGL